MTGRDWRERSARMSERKAQPGASFAAAAISGKEAEPWRAGIVGWFNPQPLEHMSEYLLRLGQAQRI